MTRKNIHIQLQHKKNITYITTQPLTSFRFDKNVRIHIQMTQQFEGIIDD